MIKVSVLYPSKPGNRFDVDYYLTVHMPMSARLLGTAVKGNFHRDRNRRSDGPDEPAPFAAIVGFTCDSVDVFMAAFAPVAGQLQGDIPNYTDIAAGDPDQRDPPRIS